jgi:uncharacterized membrane protein YhhN
MRRREAAVQYRHRLHRLRSSLNASLHQIDVDTTNDSSLCPNRIIFQNNAAPRSLISPVKDVEQFTSTGKASCLGRTAYDVGIVLITPVALILLMVAAVSGVLHLLAEYYGPKRFTYIFKPLTTILLIALAVLALPANTTYRIFVVFGLAFSLAGDIFLMLPSDHFVAGLVTFLAAHVAYLIAFSRGVAFGSRPLLLLPYFGVAVGVLWFLWSRLGRFRLPVVFYVGALVAMAWQAAGRAAIVETIPAYAAATGAALFVVSDATLAINRFGKPFRTAQALVMSTYVAAQALIALSVLERAG